jgi:O-antigen/teichoic acid export membrane protein
MSATATAVKPSQQSHFGSIYRRILAGSGTYSLATVVYRCSSLLMLPIFTRCLTASEYGTMEILDVSLNVFGMIFGANFSLALFYHYWATDLPQERKAVIGTTVLGSALFGLLAAAVGIAASRPLSMLIFQQPEYAYYIRIMLLNFGFTLPLEAVLQWLRAADRSRTFVVVSVIRVGLGSVSILVLLAFFHLGLKGVVWSNLLTSSVLAISMSAYCLRKNAVAFQPRLFGRLIRYSIPVTLSGVALFTIHYADRFFLKRYTTLAEIGVYSLAYKIGMLISNAHMAFQSYWTSQMFVLMREQTGEELFSTVFTYVTLSLAAIALALAVLCGPALSIIASPDFQGARILVPYILAAYIVRAVGDHFRGIFYTENRPELDARLNLTGAAVCAVAYVVFIPLYHVWGAVLATFIGFTVIAVLGLQWIRKLRTIHLENGRLVKICISAFLAAAVSQTVPNSSLLVSAALNSLAFLVFPLGLWILGFATDEERALVADAWGRLRCVLRVAVSVS